MKIMLQSKFNHMFETPGVVKVQFFNDFNIPLRYSQIHSLINDCNLFQNIFLET